MFASITGDDSHTRAGHSSDVQAPRDRWKTKTFDLLRILTLSPQAADVAPQLQTSGRGRDLSSTALVPISAPSIFTTHTGFVPSANEENVFGCSDREVGLYLKQTCSDG